MRKFVLRYGNRYLLRYDSDKDWLCWGNELCVLTESGEAKVVNVNKIEVMRLVESHFAGQFAGQPRCPSHVEEVK